jgi:hypothetical protein
MFKYFIVILLASVLTAHVTAQSYFNGTIVYTATTSGEPGAAKAFTDFMSSKSSVTWSDKGFQQVDNSGYKSGKVFMPYGEVRATFCDAEEKKIVTMYVQDLGNIDPAVKKLTPHIFAYELKSTGEFETILGYKCEKYKVVKSGMIAATAEVYVWIAPILKLRPSQYNFDSEWFRKLSLPPLQYGFTEGAVLKSVTSEPGYVPNQRVIVTYQAVEIKKDFYPAEFMKIPAGYKAE